MVGYDAAEVVMQLVGPVRAVGDSNVDAHRLANLNHLTEVVDKLVSEIRLAAVSATREEASMKKIGTTAKEFLESLRDD